MIRDLRAEVEMKLSQRPQVQHLLHVITIVELLKLILMLVGTVSFIQSHIDRRIEKKSS